MYNAHKYESKEMERQDLQRTPGRGRRGGAGRGLAGPDAGLPAYPDPGEANSGQYRIA